jgi:hypothetical protein
MGRGGSESDAKSTTTNAEVEGSLAKMLIGVSAFVFGLPALAEVASTLWLWSDGDSTFFLTPIVLADLCFMIRVPAAALTVGICVVAALLAVIARQWREARRALLVTLGVTAAFVATRFVVEEAQHSGATRLTQRAEGIVRAIRLYEARGGRPSTIYHLEQSGYPIPSAGIRGAGNFELAWSSMGNWELSVMIPMPPCSRALLIRTEGGPTPGRRWLDSWSLYCT